MNSRYPSSFKEIATWAAANHLPVTEARQRYAQFGILQPIAGSKALSDALVFKGGNALDFVWQPNRSTVDLDFSSRDPHLNVEQLRKLFEPSLQRVSSASGTLYRIQKIGKQPPGEDRSFITFTVSIGYALADDGRNQQRIRNGEFSKVRIPVE